MEFPSLTQTWHNTPYPAIAPTNPSLSLAGKTIFITGGGAGIGLATTHAFASAGASTIAITGRTETSLHAAKREVEAAHPNVTILPFVADVADEVAVEAAFKAVGGAVDILVNNAGYLPDVVSVADADPKDWWKAFETNVLGAFNVLRGFLRHKAGEGAVVVDVSTGVAHGGAWPGYSAYGASKLAGVKVFDGVAVEEAGVRVVHVHPGVVGTDMGRKSIAAGARLPMDDVNLPAHFLVWVVSEEASFLKGKFVWANWDVEELKALKGGIEGGSLLTVGLEGQTDWKYKSPPAQ